MAIIAIELNKTFNWQCIQSPESIGTARPINLFLLCIAYTAIHLDIHNISHVEYVYVLKSELEI